MQNRPRHGRCFVKLSVVAILFVGLTQATPTRAEFHGFGLGASGVLALGHEFQNYEPAPGIHADLWYYAPSFVGKNWILHLSTAYYQMPVRHVDNTEVINFEGFFGIETYSPGKTWLYPFFSVEVGAVIHTLGLPSNSNSTVNFGGSFGLRFRSGFSFNIGDSLGLVVTSPVTMMAFKEPVFVLTPTLSVRYAL